jgi:hypothetical protein
LICRRALPACLLVIIAALAPDAGAQRNDNRRLAWTGSHGADWTGSSWRTADIYLSSLTTTEPGWTGPIQSGAESSLPFLAGDSVLFDSTGDDVSARSISMVPRYFQWKAGSAGWGRLAA